MNKNHCPRAVRLLGCIIALGAFAAACASSQRPVPTAEEVRDGEASPLAPPLVEPATNNPPTTSTVPDGGTVASPPPEPPPAEEILTEAQMARVGELVNTAEVEQGKLALGRAKAASVRKFAAMMVKHHGDALKEQARLVKKLGLTPEDSSTAALLKEDGEKALERLKQTEAAGFDAAYVTSQIDGHQRVLQLIDAQLLPAAKTPEVADALRRARAAVERHLSESKGLQAK